MVNGSKSIDKENLVFFDPPAEEYIATTSSSVEVRLPAEVANSSVEVILPAESDVSTFFY